MRRLALIGTAALLLSVFLSAQIFGGKKTEDADASRNLSGTVLDKTKHAVPDAVVYLKNTRTLGVVTYIAGADGSYRFHNLSPNIDYEVHAESNGRKSKVKTLSSFDMHKQPHINLKLEK